MDIDKLLLYKGNDYVINDYIKIHQPSLDEIANYGQSKYFSMVRLLTSVGADLKWQLDEIGIDYTAISDFELFYGILIKNYTKEQTSILFGNLDFSKFELYQNVDNNELCLVQVIEKIINHEVKYTGIKRIIRKILRIKPETYKEKLYEKVIIDAFTYELIVSYLRCTHGLKRNDQLPANESTKRVLIEDDKDEYLRNKDKEQDDTYLINLISAMVNSSGFKYNYENVWNMKIYAFLDSVKRISKIKNAELLLQSGYSGYGINLKDINNKQLDWLGELE